LSGTIDQALRLTVSGNAFLQGLEAGPVWPNDDAFRFCRKVSFVEEIDGATRTVADNPVAWLQLLTGAKIAGLKLHHVARNEAGHPDRMLAGFANGGPRWLVESVTSDGEGDFWEPIWEVTGDPQATGGDRRIWSVTYWRVPDHFRPAVQPHRTIAAVAAALRDALEAIAAFAERAAPGAALPGWAPIFRKAILALADETAAPGDPGPAGFLSGPARGLLHAYRAGWVFGGMGSWNDGAYWGDAEAEGDDLSECLFLALQESVAAAANSSFSAISQGAIPARASDC
jgi:hypothetical protein